MENLLWSSKSAVYGTVCVPLVVYMDKGREVSGRLFFGSFRHRRLGRVKPVILNLKPGRHFVDPFPLLLRDDTRTSENHPILCEVLNYGGSNSSRESHTNNLKILFH